MSKSNPAHRIQELELLHQVSLALSSETNRELLIENILLAAMHFCTADGGTIYMPVGNGLRFAIVRNHSRGVALGGTKGRAIDLPPIPLRDAGSGKANMRNVAACCANLMRTLNIPDAYRSQEFDFSGAREFDRRYHYRSRSFLTLPMRNHENKLVGVLQLINAQDKDSGKIVAFSPERERIVEALASQAAIALDNLRLLAEQKALLESFIRLIAGAIDAKSPYTGNHCTRVPLLAEMLAKAVCAARDEPFMAFQLDETQWYELRLAAWLHDCGKVVTPVHVMDKATKLETIFDRIELIRTRFEILRRDLVAKSGSPDQAELQGELAGLDDDLRFLERINVGAETLAVEDRARIVALGKRSLYVQGKRQGLLTEDELECLCVGRGTLTEAERLQINGHIVATIRMLEALPLPENLSRVPEYAGGHHERMDGSGYPRGTFAGDLPIQARILAIADTFEALTAEDRPYKAAKTLSESMAIMGHLKANNHLDPDLFDLFIRSGVYLEFAHRFLAEELIDDVDEVGLLAIRPRPFTLPPETVRQTRRTTLLPEYLAEAVWPERWITDSTRQQSGRTDKICQPRT